MNIQEISPELRLTKEKISQQDRKQTNQESKSLQIISGIKHNTLETVSFKSEQERSKHEKHENFQNKPESDSVIISTPIKNRSNYYHLYSAKKQVKLPRNK